MASIRKRRYAIPPDAENSRVGRIWIIESLSDKERHTGTALYNHIRDVQITRPEHEQIPITLRRVESATQLIALLEEIRADVEATGRVPIIDIECHGLPDLSGVALKDGSLATWDQLKPYFQAINLACQFNLFLVMACCNGGYFGREERLDEQAAALAYLGPMEDVWNNELSAALIAFFTALLVRRDVAAAIDALHAAVPSFPFFYANAGGIFSGAAEGYLRRVMSTRGQRERARTQIKRLLAEGKPAPGINEMVRRMQGIERETIARMIRAYFALDVLPENAKRFPIDYWMLWRAVRERP